MEIISRQEAIAKGIKTYFTGKPCPHGHVSERFVANFWCKQCSYEKTIEWNKENAELKKKLWNEWAAKNNEKQIIKRKEKRALDPEKYREKYRKWVKQNPEKARINSARRRKYFPEESASFTQEEIQRIHKNQKYKCINCNKSTKKKYHIDHIVPVSRGGSNDISNIQILCPPCNMSKGAKDPSLWARLNGRLL